MAAQALKSAVVAALSARAVTRPEPPADATRSVEGLRCSCRDCAALRSFVVDARRLETEFRVAQRRREHLRSSACGLDLSFETLRVGSPFRLQVRKTMASFERALARYEADQATVTRLRSELAATD